MAKRRRSTGGAIGGILAGFDHQVFRATKPPAELVESAKPLPAIAGSDGSMLSIEVPADPSDASPSSAAGEGILVPPADQVTSGAAEVPRHPSVRPVNGPSDG